MPNRKWKNGGNMFLCYTLKQLLLKQTNTCFCMELHVLRMWQSFKWLAKKTCLMLKKSVRMWCQSVNVVYVFSMFGQCFSAINCRYGQAVRQTGVSVLLQIAVALLCLQCPALSEEWQERKKERQLKIYEMSVWKCVSVSMCAYWF